MKRPDKKAIISLLAGVMLLVGLTSGCGGNPTSSNVSPNASASATSGEGQGTGSQASGVTESGLSTGSETTTGGTGVTTQKGSGSNAITSATRSTTVSKSTSNSGTPTSPSPGKDTAVRDLGGRTITFMTIWDEPIKGNTVRENIYWAKKTEVQETYNVVFKHVYGTGDWYTTYQASVMSGAPIADVVCCKENPLPAIKNGLFYDLSKLDELDFNEDKWDKAVKDLGTLNGKVYTMLSTRYQPRNLVVYNKDLFSRYGVEDLYTLQKQGKLTLDKLVEIATKISQASGAPSLYGGIQTFDVHQMFAYAYGGQFVTREAGTMNFSSTINSTEVVNGFKRAQELLTDGVLFDGTGASGWTWVREQFYKGTVPIVLDGNLQDYFTNCGFDVGVCMLPDIKGGVVDMYSDTSWCAISANTSKPDDVALVWDQMTDVIFDVNYKTRYQDILSEDAMELVNAQSQRQTQGASKLDYYFIVDIWADGVGSTLLGMVAGEVTPAQALQTINNVLANKLKSM